MLGLGRKRFGGEEGVNEGHDDRMSTLRAVPAQNPFSLNAFMNVNSFSAASRDMYIQLPEDRLRR
jgi:hypothetical protein